MDYSITINSAQLQQKVDELEKNYETTLGAKCKNDSWLPTKQQLVRIANIALTAIACLNAIAAAAVAGAFIGLYLPAVCVVAPIIISIVSFLTAYGNYVETCNSFNKYDLDNKKERQQFIKETSHFRGINYLNMIRCSGISVQAIADYKLCGDHVTAREYAALTVVGQEIQKLEQQATTLDCHARICSNFNEVYNQLVTLYEKLHVINLLTLDTTHTPKNQEPTLSYGGFSLLHPQEAIEHATRIVAPTIGDPDDLTDEYHTHIWKMVGTALLIAAIASAAIYLLATMGPLTITVGRYWSRTILNPDAIVQLCSVIGLAIPLIFSGTKFYQMTQSSTYKLHDANVRREFTEKFEGKTHEEICEIMQQKGITRKQVIGYSLLGDRASAEDYAKLSLLRTLHVYSNYARRQSPLQQLYSDLSAPINRALAFSSQALISLGKKLEPNKN